MSEKITKHHCHICDTNSLVLLKYTGVVKIYKCLKCGSTIKTTSPEEDQVRISTANYVKPELRDEYSRKRKNYHQYIYDLVLKFSGEKHGSAIDIGANYGQLLEIFQKNGWEAFGVEPNVKCLAQMKENGISAYAQLDDLINDDNSCNKFFDAIIFVDVLYYIDDPVKLLTKCYNILKPGGIILLRTYHRSYLLFLRFFFKNIINLIYGDSKIDFSIKGLFLLGQIAGFKKDNIIVFSEPGYIRKEGGLRLIYDIFRIFRLNNILGPGIITIMKKSNS